MSLTFRYRAATPAGELVEGVVRADNERNALEELRRQTLVPVAIEADGNTRPRRPRLGASRADAVATAMRTMAALAGGGAPLHRVLEFTQRHAEHPDVASALAAVRDEVQSGQSLSAALRERTDLFGALAPAMVRAGEESGTLDAALSRMADFFPRYGSGRPPSRVSIPTAAATPTSARSPPIRICAVTCAGFCVSTSLRSRSSASGALRAPPPGSWTSMRQPVAAR